MSITSKQIIKIHTLLPSQIKDDKDAKKQFVVQFTGNKEKCSTKDLSYEQAENMITTLVTGKPATMAAWASFDKTNKQHMYMLSLCRQIPWIIFNEKAQKMVADLEKFGAWLYKYGYKKKHLNLYTPEELPKLVLQLEQVVKHKLGK